MNNSLLQFFSFFFYPNPGNADYGSPKSVALMVFCVLLIVGAGAVSVWRRKLQNAVTRKLSRSWSTAMVWFGISGLLLVIARVEQIQFVSMRILWVVWFVIAALFVFLQVRIFRARHYEVLPKEVSRDPRAKYLPKKRR